MSTQFVRWLSPLLLLIFLASGCQIVPKRYYQEATTKLALSQRSVKQQAETIAQLKESNRDLEAVNATLNDELKELSIMMQRIKKTHSRGGAAAQKAIKALKKEKYAMRHSLVSLRKKYEAEKRKLAKALRSTSRATTPVVSSSSSALKPPEKPLVIVPKQEKPSHGSSLASEKLLPVDSGQGTSVSAMVPGADVALIPESKSAEGQEVLEPTSVEDQEVLEPTSVEDQEVLEPISAEDQETGEAPNQIQTPNNQLAGKDTPNRLLPSEALPILIDINARTAQDIMEHLGVSEDIAEGIVANRPYRFPAELVIKGAITRETYQKIKGKVFATK